MAKARALDKRRKSIKNIRKITRTMELVSTDQFRRAMKRAVAAGSYSARLVSLVRDLLQSGSEIQHPLLISRKTKKRAALFLLTANRGMCGGYNSGVIRAGLARLDQLKKEYENVELFVVGKRGVAFMSYRGIEIARSFTQFTDKPTLDEVMTIANDCLARFRSGDLDRIDISYSRFVSLSKQYPTSETLLPISELSNGDEKSEVIERTLDYEFLPSALDIFEEVLPNAFRVKLFKGFLDAAVSEQIARMMAMKAATDNADQMISALTTTYNRARQSQITNEIIEVISGASALQ